MRNLLSAIAAAAILVGVAPTTAASELLPVNPLGELADCVGLYSQDAGFPNKCTGLYRDDDADQWCIGTWKANNKTFDCNGYAVDEPSASGATSEIVDLNGLANERCLGSYDSEAGVCYGWYYEGEMIGRDACTGQKWTERPGRDARCRGVSW